MVNYKEACITAVSNLKHKDKIQFAFNEEILFPTIPRNFQGTKLLF